MVLRVTVCKYCGVARASTEYYDGCVKIRVCKYCLDKRKRLDAEKLPDFTQLPDLINRFFNTDWSDNSDNSILPQETPEQREYKRLFGSYKPNLEKVDEILGVVKNESYIQYNTPPTRELKCDDIEFKQPYHFYTHCAICGKPTARGRKYCYRCYRPSYLKSCCKILKHHAKQLQHDPNRLTTDFIKRISSCDCKKDGDSE